MCTSTASAPQSDERERALEGKRAAEPCSPASNVRTVDVRRERHSSAVPRDDDELVGARGERRTRSSVCASAGSSGIERLRDEDELHQRAPASTRRRARGRRCAKSVGRLVPAAVGLARGSARAAPRARGRRARAQCRDERRRCHPAATSRPSRSSVTMSGMPPASVATTPRPRANASSTTRPSPSGHDGSTSARDASILARDLRRRELAVMVDRRRGARAGARRRRACASPARRSSAARRSGAARPAATPRRARRCSCTARARRRTTIGARLERAPAGGSANAERSL